MLLDKDYPATHSMNTAWFAIDSDGNVAFLQFEDNGPVPNVCQKDLSFYEVICDEMATEKSSEVRDLCYTEEQARNLEIRLENRPASDFVSVTIIKIDTSKTEEFKNYCKLYSNNPAYYVINEAVGLYIVDFGGWPCESIQQMLDNGIILASQFLEPQYISGDFLDYEDYNWEGFPFFCYTQSYDPKSLIERTNSPTIPLKESQLSKRAFHYALRFPFSFADTEKFQISEFFISSEYREEIKEYSGVRWTLWNELPVSADSRRLFRECILGQLDCEKCRKCDNINPRGRRWTGNFVSVQYGLEPTLMAIVSPIEQETNSIKWDTIAPIINWVIKINLIGGTARFVGKTYEDNKELYAARLALRFANCREYFEENIDMIKPYALIMSAETRLFLSQYYDFSNGFLVLNDIKYPFFLFEDIEKCISELNSLASQPYRGIRTPRIKRLKDDR